MTLVIIAGRMFAFIVPICVFEHFSSSQSGGKSSYYQTMITKIKSRGIPPYGGVNLATFSLQPQFVTPHDFCAYTANKRMLYVVNKVAEDEYLVLYDFHGLSHDGYSPEPLLIVTDHDYADGENLQDGEYVFMGNKSYSTVSGTRKTVRMFVDFRQ